MLGQVGAGLLRRVHGAQQTVREVQGWPLVQHGNLWKTYVGTVTLCARADNIPKYCVAMKKGWELVHAHEWVKNYAQAGKPDKGKTPEVGRGQTGCFERARKRWETARRGRVGGGGRCLPRWRVCVEAEGAYSDGGAFGLAKRASQGRTRWEVPRRVRQGAK